MRNITLKEMNMISGGKDTQGDNFSFLVFKILVVGFAGFMLDKDLLIVAGVGAAYAAVMFIIGDNYLFPDNSVHTPIIPATNDTVPATV